METKHPENHVQTSKHFFLDSSNVKSYLVSKSMVVREQAQDFCVKECPFCHPIKGKRDNMWKLFVRKDSGAFFCHRCATQGSWFDLKKKLGDVPDIEDHRGRKAIGNRAYRKPDQIAANFYEIEIADSENAAFKYITEVRKLTQETIETFRVGCGLYKFSDEFDQWFETPCITFPWIKPDSQGLLEIVRIKARALFDKSYMMLDPSGGQWWWFGYHAIPAECKEIAICEGEFDAMTVWQETGIPAISLPNGANSLPPEIIPDLDRFETIYLWMDGDEVGMNAATGFALKLGVGRVKIVTIPRNPSGETPKDANDALRAGYDIFDLITKAKPLPHQQIITFEDMKDKIYDELANPGAIRGVKYDTVPGLNDILKGHRRGELTLLSGLPGRGKTSVESQLSLDLSIRGVNTLWGSFEIPNTKLCKKMINQFSGLNMEQNLGQFEKVSESFSKVPMYFMRFYGSTGLPNILDAMEYAVYCLDVSHIVLDNLQFMTSGPGNHGARRFEIQDDAITQFRSFSVSRNVHITLIAHARKQEADDKPIGMNDIFGTGKAMQECDNVLIVQYLSDNVKYLEVKKNRHDGDLGRVYFKYSKENNRVTQLTEEEIRERQEEEKERLKSKFYVPGSDSRKFIKPKGGKGMYHD